MPPRTRRWTDLWVQVKRYPLMILVTLFLLALILLPIVRLIITSFLVGHPAMPEGWSIDTYRHALSLPLFYQALGTTLFLATVGTLITVSIAILFAWLIERTDMPCRNLAWVLLLIPLATPGILVALSWGLLLGPRAGVINLILRSILEKVGIVSDHGADQHLFHGRPPVSGWFEWGFDRLPHDRRRIPDDGSRLGRGCPGFEGRQWQPHCSRSFCRC